MESNNSKITIDEFELLLQKHSLKQPSVLYNQVPATENAYKPQDVIKTVYTQIKAIQMADSSKIVQGANKNLNVSNKSYFLPINKLPVYTSNVQRAPPIDLNKFETQCITNTQLIDIVDHAEALDRVTNTGMTQEFDISFAPNEDKNIDNLIANDGKVSPELFKEINNTHDSAIEEENVLIDIKSIENKKVVIDKETQYFKEVISPVNNMNKAIRLSKSPIMEQNITFEDLAVNMNCQLLKTHLEDTVTFIENLPITQEDNELTDILDNEKMDIDTEQVEQILPSPVLNMNVRKRKIRPPSPLVVSLEEFENFENLAFPLIDENKDNETVKHLINSQIIGRELCLNTNDGIFDIERFSPVLEFKNNELKIKAEDMKTPVKKMLDDDIEKRSESLKDEILFSSDEEDYVYKELKDLPLTCALETSFSDQRSTLEKIMYVGFQTASNKTIKICTESFEKAHSILIDDNSTGENFNLTDLVKKCDAISSKHENSINSTEKTSEALGTIADESGQSCLSITENDIEKNEYKDANKYPFNKQKFEEFVTANNKKIKMSNKAMKKCQEVFKDINLNENFHDSEIEEKTKAAKEETYSCYTKNKFENDKKNMIDDKINDDLLLEEFENIEMSLTHKEMSEKSTEMLPFRGFKTANNKNIKISEEAIAKSKNIFQDIDAELDKHSNITDVNMNNNAKEISSAFKTCGHVKTFKSESIENKINKFPHIIAENQNISQEIKVVNNDVDIINDINQPSTSKAVFVGFKTASNREIKISDEALANTKDVFKDIGKEKPKAEAKNISNKSGAFLGLKTANNKDIKISNEAFLKSKNVFKYIDEEQSKETSLNLSQKSSNKPPFVGFKTANNKNIIISKKAWSKTKDVFEEIGTKNISKSQIDNTNISLKEFDTVKNTTVQKEVFQKNDIIPNYVNMKDLNEISFQDFKRTNNKTVDISDPAVVKSKVFANLDKNLDRKQPYLYETKVESRLGFKGFQTANKKSVTVSATAMSRSQKILLKVDGINEPKEIQMNVAKAKFAGFQTASKKPVEVSKEATIASKNLFRDINEVNVKKIENNFTGFKTASNKNVNISDEALAKCKKIFDSIEDLPITNNYAPNSERDVTFNTFKTGTNKNVRISKASLEKSKEIFNNIDNSDKKTTETFFGGFQTANKKKVTISEKALAKSKQLFSDIDTDKDILTTQNNKTHLKNDNVETENVKSSTNNIVKFQNVNNKQIATIEDLNKCKKDFVEDSVSHKDNDLPKTNRLEDTYHEGNMESLLSTQVLNNFEDDLCTEDFRVKPSADKRSGSPILSCPKAKKRKRFETPYNIKPKIIDFKDIKEVNKPPTVIKFNEDYKKNKKYTLNDLQKLENEQNELHKLENRQNDMHKHVNEQNDLHELKAKINPYILNFDLENILNFEFDKERNDLKDGKMTIDDIKQTFTEAVNKKLIPDGWIDIHLKLIIWKLISYEIKFPNTLGTVCTVKNVLDQLKYRYDKELYNAERPILRKILEKDDVASKTMVLCVAGIYIDGVSVINVTNPTNIELLLTDGWYFVKATIDNMLSKLVYDGKIVVGSKIATSGAELKNCDEGVSPWEDTTAVRLAISANSTRRAHWSARLGLCPGTVAARLSGVRTGGGRVAKIRVLVSRVYPRVYVERFEDGSTVTRSERLENQYQMKYDAERESMIEKICEEVEKELSDQDSQDSESTLDGSNKRKCYDSGSLIAKHMKTSKDPMEFRAQLTSTEVQLLQEHVSKQRDKYLQTIQEKIQERLKPRNVVTLARGRVADLERDGDKVTVTKGMLSIWKPNDEVLEIFKEGAWLEVTNLMPTAFRNSEIQLSAGRQSFFRPLKHKEEEVFKPYIESLKRICHNIKDLSQNPSMSTDYNEIDTVGIVFAIEPPSREFESNKNQFQNLYLADIDKNIICVNFWGGIKKFGYENVLDTGQVIYCGNLQKRAGNTRKNIPQYRATEFSIFSKTPKNERAREMINEINKKMFCLDRRKFCDDCVAVKQNYSALKCFKDNENFSPYRFNRSDYNLAKNKMFIDTPLGIKIDRKTEDFSLSGLDFESTFKQQDTQELSPKTLQRKKKVNEKIAKLKMYGEPPPLNPINIINKSKSATNSYKSPLVAKTDSAAILKKEDNVTSGHNVKNVAMSTKLPEQSVDRNSDAKSILDSPIISMNRTYVKRGSGNPVKLNFSDGVALNDSVDHFAEEFDGSPPLSLD